MPFDEFADSYRDRLGVISLDRAVEAVLIAFGLPRPDAVRPVTVGYEDLNVVLEFEAGSHFLKLFRSGPDGRGVRAIRVDRVALDSCRCSAPSPSAARSRARDSGRATSRPLPGG